MSNFTKSSIQIFCLAILLSLAIFGSAVAQPSKQSTAISKQKLGEAIRQYILENPEIILEAIQSLREKETRKKQQRIQDNLTKLRVELENDPSTPFSGNPNGDVVVSEFFDYRCPYCKRVNSFVSDVVKADGRTRYVYIEFPVLGPESVLASRVALATWNQDRSKYANMHDALMRAKGELSERRLMKIAEDIGLNRGRLKKDMNSPAITKKLRRNQELASALNIRGTPGFVIGGNIVRGAFDESTLKKLIAAARSKKRKTLNIEAGPSSSR